MNKILTRPQELTKNPRVLYTGNHYISLPEIDNADASITSLNIVSLSNKGLVELKGKDKLFKLIFVKDGNVLKLTRVIVKSEANYLPTYQMQFSSGISVKVKIVPDLKEKGFMYTFESSEEVDIHLICSFDNMNFLRFNAHPINFEKEIKQDKWLGNPGVAFSANNIAFAMAFGGNSDFSFTEEAEKLILKIKCSSQNCFYITVNSDLDGASTTLIHLKRKGFASIYREIKAWLMGNIISYQPDLSLEKRMNQNLFFNYFFSLGKDMESDRYIALTSRSPRYYVSGAFWERDSFLWSFPALKLVDQELYDKLIREMILVHSKNAGDHAHYIDGTVLYPGFELDEAASYFILTKDFLVADSEILRALEEVWRRIEQEFDQKTGLYKTFLLPSDDPSEYPLVTIDNVLLWRGLINLRDFYKRLGFPEKVAKLEEKILGIRDGIYQHLVKKVNGKDMFVWSSDGDSNYRLYNDPPGNLGLLPFYGFIDGKDPLFKNTIEYYYSADYPYYFEDAQIRELACDHHPNTPSGLGLCGSILNPLLRQQALEWLKKAKMDYGLLSESFDKDTGMAKTGVGFATGSGYLAFVLHETLVKGSPE